jgi:hypothetical protein
MIFGTMKKYIILGWSLFLSLGASLLTFLLMQSGKNRREKKAAEARLKHAQDVMTQDKEIDREHDKRTEDLADEIKNKKKSSELENPNDW